jgi:hypothetical protein
VKEFWRTVNFERGDAEAGGETDWTETSVISDPGFIRGILATAEGLFDQRTTSSVRASRLARSQARPVYMAMGEEVYTSSTQEQTSGSPGLRSDRGGGCGPLVVRFGVQEARAKQDVTTAVNRAAPRATLQKGEAATAGTLALHERSTGHGAAWALRWTPGSPWKTATAPWPLRALIVPNRQQPESPGWFARLKLFGNSDPKRRSSSASGEGRRRRSPGERGTRKGRRRTPTRRGRYDAAQSLVAVMVTGE